MSDEAAIGIFTLLAIFSPLIVAPLLAKLGAWVMECVNDGIGNFSDSDY